MSGGVAVLCTSCHRECSVLDGYHKVIVKAGGLARPRLLVRLEAEVYIVSVHNMSLFRCVALRICNRADSTDVLFGMNDSDFSEIASKKPGRHGK